MTEVGWRAGRSQVSFTDELRQRVRERLAFCPTCGQPTTEGGVRAQSDAIPGVSHTTLWRFLTGRGDPSGKLIDTLVAWLDESGGGQEGAKK